MRLGKLFLFFLIGFSLLKDTCQHVSVHDKKIPPALRRIRGRNQVRGAAEADQARAEDLKKINGDGANQKVLYDPYEKLFKDDKGEPSVLWVVSYGGDPFGFEVIIFALTPFIVAKLIRVCRNIFRPNLHLRQGITDFPLIPLIYLQQTKLEKKVKRERRNGIDWLGKKFLIRASDNFIDVQDIPVEPAQKVISQNPWALLRFMTKFSEADSGQGAASPSGDKKRPSNKVAPAKLPNKTKTKRPVGSPDATDQSGTASSSDDEAARRNTKVKFGTNTAGLTDTKDVMKKDAKMPYHLKQFGGLAPKEDQKPKTSDPEGPSPSDPKNK